MATLEREIERPAFLDAPGAQAQLTFAGGTVAVPVRERPVRGVRVESLSERLRRERATAPKTSVSPSGDAGAEQTVTTRGGGATLDDMLVGAWEGLSARRTVSCLVCGGAMDPRAGAHGGHCGDCGSQLR